MSTEETFPLQLQDLPQTVKDSTKDFTSSYTVTIIINQTPLGSGTLVELDGKFGVLTAEHVVRPPDHPKLWLKDAHDNGAKLLIPPANFPGGLEFSARDFRLFSTSRNNDAYGPDLSFIELSPGPLLEGLKGRRSFYPVANGTELKLVESKNDLGFYAFCGFPGTQQHPQSPTLGYSKVIKVSGFAFITGADSYEERGDWDYIELSVNPSEITDIGDSFGGVSGGGVWKVFFGREHNDPRGIIKFLSMTLAGVAFCESWAPDGRFFVRGHGPKSIYQTFLPELRKRLKELWLPRL